jgi:phosphoribosylformylglycinamidine synthase subunit PurS
MRFVAHVEVSLKPGLLDPQGRAIEGALPALGWSNVSDVRVGKYVRLALDAEDGAAAKAQVDEMSRRLLSNPVIEDVVIRDVVEDGGLAAEDRRR